MSEIATQPRLAVLLTTYNGAAFLVEQLNSILLQSDKNFVVVIRDDGSTDATPALLNKYSREYPERIHLINSDGKNLGPSQSFAVLMYYVLEHKKELNLDRAYMMFCDQDDVWQQRKVEISMREMLFLESSGACGALVHTDLRVVDENLQLIAESLVKYQGLRPDHPGFGRVLLANAVTGCSTVINETLAYKALPIPADAVMHDWWLALVARVFGKSSFLQDALVDYRQHGSNALGAKAQQKTKLFSPAAIGKVFDTSSQQILITVAQQSRAFYSRYKDSLSLKQKLICKICNGVAKRSAPVQKLLYRMLIRF